MPLSSLKDGPYRSPAAARSAYIRGTSSGSGTEARTASVLRILAAFSVALAPGWCSSLAAEPGSVAAVAAVALACGGCCICPTSASEKPLAWEMLTRVAFTCTCQVAMNELGGPHRGTGV